MNVPRRYPGVLFGGSGARVAEGFEKKAGTNAGPQAWWLAPRKRVDWMFLRFGGMVGRCGISMEPHRLLVYCVPGLG